MMTWTRRDGVSIPLVDMSDKHLTNALGMCFRARARNLSSHVHAKLMTAITALLLEIERREEFELRKKDADSTLTSLTPQEATPESLVEEDAS